LKLGLSSDTHYNHTELQCALELLVDRSEFPCAGDSRCQSRFTGQFLATPRGCNVHAIVGNLDRTILYVQSHSLRSSPNVDPEELRDQGERPDTLSRQLGSADIATFRGSPWDTVRTASGPHESTANQHDLKRAAEAPMDIVVLGHTHQPFSALASGTLFPHPGSCGESRDPSGLHTRAALDVVRGEVEISSFSA